MTRNWETCVAMESKKRNWISIVRQSNQEGKAFREVSRTKSHISSAAPFQRSRGSSELMCDRHLQQAASMRGTNLTLADSAPAKGTTSPGTKSRLRLRMLEGFRS